MKINIDLGEVRYKNISSNLYILTNPLPDGKAEAEIEDLFDKEALSHRIDGKSFSRGKDFNKNNNYSKDIFSHYVAKNYNLINFSGFKEMLDDINAIVDKHKK